jgi:urease accessory protein UreE
MDDDTATRFQSGDLLEFNDGDLVMVTAAEDGLWVVTDYPHMRATMVQSTEELELSDIVAVYRKL